MIIWLVLRLEIRCSRVMTRAIARAFPRSLSLLRPRSTTAAAIHPPPPVPSSSSSGMRNLDTPLVSNPLSKMCMQPEIRRQISQKSCGRISACHMPDVSSCSSRKPAHMKCGRAVENTGIFSQDAVSSAGEAQAQPMFFFKNPRSIGWLPKLW